MPHLINITIELATEYEKEARRISEWLANDLMDYDKVSVVAVEPPKLGSLDDNEDW